MVPETRQFPVVVVSKTTAGEPYWYARHDVTGSDLYYLRRATAQPYHILKSLTNGGSVTKQNPLTDPTSVAITQIPNLLFLCSITPNPRWRRYNPSTGWAIRLSWSWLEPLECFARWVSCWFAIFRHHTTLLSPPSQMTQQHFVRDCIVHFKPSEKRSISRND